jgi:radical SAM superfamily enzyme YgiQ (UPF0313 family)
MRVLFIEPRVNNPVRINIALPMTFLALYSYAKTRLKDIEFYYHSMEIDWALGNPQSLDSIYKKYKPDVVTSSAISCNFNAVASILNFFKDNKCITILGGLFPTANDRWVLDKFSFINMVCKGEGEQTFVDILNKLKTNSSYRDVNGISFIDNGKYMSNPDRSLIQDLNCLPPICFDRIPINIYKQFETRYYVFASRGCHYNCDFCTLTSHWQNKNRQYSIERVVNEIEHIINLFSPQLISFGDDTLSLDKSYLFQLCEELACRDFPVKFGGKTRIDLIDSETLKLMRKAGFAEISFGVESHDANQLEILKKGGIVSALSNLQKTIREASDLGFKTNLNFILGVPGETDKSLREKASFIIKHCSYPNVVPLLGFITPHRGTRIYNNKKQLGLRIMDNNYDHYNHLQPVCLAESLGANGIELLQQTYNFISKKTFSEKFNPLLEEHRQELICSH